MHPLEDYAIKDLKYKTAITVSDDFAFGYEQMGGFQRAFELREITEFRVPPGVLKE